MSYSSISHEKIYQKLGALEARVTVLEQVIHDMSRDLKMLIAAANMGRGAWWVLIKFGALLMLLVPAFAWIYEKLK